MYKKYKCKKYEILRYVYLQLSLANNMHITQRQHSAAIIMSREMFR